MTSKSSMDEIIDLELLFQCMICCVCIAGAHAVGNMFLICLALLFYLCIVVFSKPQQLLPIMLLFLPWSAVLKLEPNSISFCSIATLIVLGKITVLYPVRFRKQNLLVMGILVVITLTAKLVHAYSLSTEYILFFAMLLFFPLYLENFRDKILFESSVVFYSCGIIVSVVVSLMLGNNPNLLAFIRTIEYTNIGVTRLSGFCPDPNFYSARVVTAIGGVLILINKSQLKISSNILLLIALVACGLISVSKSFLLSLFLVVVLWLLCSLSERKIISRVVRGILLLIIMCIIILQSGVFSELINEYLSRFTDINDFSSLTTGRSELWKSYLQHFIDNPFELLIGKGYTSTLDGVAKGSHNTVIQCVYQLGVIGMALLVFNIYSTLVYVRVA